MALDGFQTSHKPTVADIEALGYRQMEDGRFMALDGESFIGADEAEALAQKGPDADPLIDGVQYRSVPAESVTQLKAQGLNVQNHPEYGWIAPDDAKYAAAFPDRASSSIFERGPFILSGGLAALAAGAGAAGAGAPAHTR